MNQRLNGLVRYAVQDRLCWTNEMEVVHRLSVVCFSIFFRSGHLNPTFANAAAANLSQWPRDTATNTGEPNSYCMTAVFELQHPQRFAFRQILEHERNHLCVAWCTRRVHGGESISGHLRQAAAPSSALPSGPAAQWRPPVSGHSDTPSGGE